MSLSLLAGAAISGPAAAQIPAGGPQSPASTGGEAGAPVTGTAPGAPVAGGAPGAAPAIPGPAPEVLPPPPTGGFGIPSAVAPPYSVNAEAPTLVSPPTLRLLAPHAGVIPLQAYNPSAPSILFQPTVFVSETFTDNVNYAHSPRQFAAITQLGAGASISADTPRLQAVASGYANGNLYLPSTNSGLNQVYGTLYANGTATAYPGLAYVDFQSSISQTTTLPGFGFQNLSTLPRNQQTQQYITEISPYIRESYDGLVDTELRYRFAYSNYGGSTVVQTAPLVPGLVNLSASTLNEGTFVAATGENFQYFLSRFTADAFEYNTGPLAQNTQVSAYNDFEYQFTPAVAALARAGYQNLRFPGSPAATFAGVTWLAGGRLGTLDPVQPAYVILQYGKQQGANGITGIAQVNLTPTLVLTANAVQGVSTQGQLFQNNLATSTLSPSGGIVNQITGLPSASFTPGVGLTNNVYRQHLYNIGLTDVIPPNSYSLYAFYDVFQTLTQPITPPTKSLGINFTYTRDIRPDMSGYASLGYVNSVNSPTVTTSGVVSPGTITNFNTVSASLGINYIFARALTGSIVYSFSYTNNGAVLLGGHPGDVFANQLQFLLSKTF